MATTCSGPTPNISCRCDRCGVYRGITCQTCEDDAKWAQIVEQRHVLGDWLFAPTGSPSSPPAHDVESPERRGGPPSGKSPASAPAEPVKTPARLEQWALWQFPDPFGHAPWTAQQQHVR